MKKIFDIYGSETDGLELCRKAVEVALGIQLTPHESSYFGNYYRWGQPYGEELILQKNFNEAEQEVQEERFKQAKVLLYVNLSSEPEQIRKKLAEHADRLTFLETKEL